MAFLVVVTGHAGRWEVTVCGFSCCLAPFQLLGIAYGRPGKLSGLV
jgi:hypothetical protein